MTHISDPKKVQSLYPTILLCSSSCLLMAVLFWLHLLSWRLYSSGCPLLATHADLMTVLF